MKRFINPAAGAAVAATLLLAVGAAPIAAQDASPSSAPSAAAPTGLKAIYVSSEPIGVNPFLQLIKDGLTAAGTEGLIHPGTTGPYAHMNLDHYFASWFERYARSFGGTIAGGTSEIQRNIIAQQVLGLPRR
jgi:alkylation response protein AidB-like acyl-CoA dehydrogenase